jgi:hypothetical protein
MWNYGLYIFIVVIEKNANYIGIGDAPKIKKRLSCENRFF